MPRVPVTGGTVSRSKVKGQGQYVAVRLCLVIDDYCYICIFISPEAGSQKTNKKTTSKK